MVYCLRSRTERAANVANITARFNLLVEAGLNLSATIDERGRNFAMILAASGIKWTDFHEALIVHGFVDLAAVDNAGWTALDHAFSVFRTKRATMQTRSKTPPQPLLYYTLLKGLQKDKFTTSSVTEFLMRLEKKHFLTPQHPPLLEQWIAKMVPDESLRAKHMGRLLEVFAVVRYFSSPFVGEKGADTLQPLSVQIITVRFALHH
jgi:hypothetical protein